MVQYELKQSQNVAQNVFFSTTQKKIWIAIVVVVMDGMDNGLKKKKP